MKDWLTHADEDRMAGAATLATVMLTRLAELSAARVQSKSVIDLLEAGDLPGARAMLRQALSAVAEIRGVVTSLEDLARTGT